MMEELVKSSVEQLADAISLLQKSSDQMFKDIERLNAELAEVNGEMQDIMHYAEFATFNASEGYNIAKELKNVREKRRKIKDELDVLTFIQQTVKERKQQINGLSSIVKGVNVAKAKQENRIYKPRVRVEMFERLKSK